IEIVAWWLVLVTASSAVAWLIDRLARRLLPLSVMLRMTMLFPDRAPSRFGVALRSTNLGELRRRVAATDPDGETDLTEAARLIMALASALNDYDRRLRGHGERTRAYADMLAAEMNVSRDGRDKLRWAPAPRHRQSRDPVRDPQQGRTSGRRRNGDRPPASRPGDASRRSAG